MKKAGRIVSYLLVLTLFTSLLCGLGFKSTGVAADETEEKTFNVVEIVPDADMATFGYLVAGQEPRIGGKSVADNFSLSSNDSFRTYLRNNNICEAAGGTVGNLDYVSTNRFVNQILNNVIPTTDVTWKVVVKTITPSSLSDDDEMDTILKNAHLIVINETVPAALNLKGTNKHFYQDKSLTWNKVYKIFKRIAGVSCDPVPYIIDYNIYSNIVGSGNTTYWDDVRNTNISDTLQKAVLGDDGQPVAKTQFPFSYISATQIDELAESAPVSELGKESDVNMGSTNNAFKLFKLLSCINPATMYGLLFTETDDSYGIDSDGNLITVGQGDGVNSKVFNLGVEYSAWGDQYIRPYYLTAATRVLKEGSTTEYDTKITKSVDKVEKIMGWKNSFEYNSSSSFCKVIGDNTIASSDTPEEVPSDSGEDIEVTSPASGGVVNALDFVEDVTLKLAWSNFYIKIKTNNPGEKVTNWEMKFTVKDDRVSSINSSGNYTVTYDKESQIMTVSSDKDYAGIEKGTNEISFNGGCSYNNTEIPIAIEKYVPTPTPTPVPEDDPEDINFTDDIDTNVTIPGRGMVYNSSLGIAYVINSFSTALSNMLSAFNTDATGLNDYHSYRYLVVSDNGVSKSVNRMLVADMVNYANKKNIGLVGGLTIECMSKYQFDDISENLLQTYDGIYKPKSVSFTSSGTTKYSAYPSGKKTASKDNFLKLFKSKVGTKFGIRYNVTPAEYFSFYKTTYVNQNGWAGYLGNTINGSVDENYRVPGNINYINSDYHKARTLDFDFDLIGGSGSYEAYVYIDRDHDELFNEVAFTENAGNAGEKITLTLRGSSCYKEDKDKKRIPYTIDLDKVLGKDYVGGFKWKLVVKNGSEYMSKTGFSACRKNPDGAPQEVNILQIYPTDFTVAYGESMNMWQDAGGKGASPVYSSNPMLLLPSTDEVSGISQFNVSGTDLGSAGTATNIGTTENPIYKYSGGNGWKGLVAFLSGKMTIDCITGKSNQKDKANGVVKSDGTVEFKEYDASSIEKNTILSLSSSAIASPGKRDNILINAAYLGYFIDKLKSDYTINSNRLSVYQFNKDVKDLKIIYNSKTGRLSAPSAKPVKNLNNSLRYVYKPEDLGLTSDDLKETIEGGKKKYLVDSNYGLIYGVRTSSTSVEYFEATEPKIKGTGIAVGTAAMEPLDYDLVMMGFGSNMDYMSKEAVDLIEKYLKANGPAFIGNGAVTSSLNNTLGQRIKSIIGMSNAPTAKYGGQYDNGGPATMMVTNETLFSNYPYRVPHYMKNTSAHKQEYRLDLTSTLTDKTSGDDIVHSTVVAFTKYQKGAGDKYGNWGEAAENYFLYKRGNITFCGFGGTFSNGGWDQKGGSMTMSECILVVNALVTTSRFKSDGIADDPFMNCIDVDRGVLVQDDTAVEDDELIGSAKKKYYCKDSVYTDYDSFGIALKYEKKAADVDISLTSSIEDDAVVSTGLQPTGFDDPGEDIRWIPYKVKLAIATATLDIQTTDGKSLSGIVEVRKDDGGNNGYTIESNGTYYIGIPLKSSEYASVNSSDKLGFSFKKAEETDTSNNVDQFQIKMVLKDASNNEIEQHDIVMVRRVLYPVN